MEKIRIGVLGASGYTGADLVRLAARHPNVEIVALTANTHAGKAMAEVFPHLFMLDLPRLVDWEEVDWSAPRRGLLRAAARHHAGDHRGGARRQSEHQGDRHVGRFPAARHGDLRRMVWPRASRARSAARGRLRPDRVLSGEDPLGAADRLPGLLSDRGAAGAGAGRKSRADRQPATSSSTRNRASRARAGRRSRTRSSARPGRGSRPIRSRSIATRRKSSRRSVRRSARRSSSTSRRTSSR